MPLLKELQDKVSATHLLVRPAEEWNKLAEKVQQAWASGDGQQLETARTFHQIAWASVVRNSLADHFEEVGITATPATADWGIATLTTSRRSCEPQLSLPDAAGNSTSTEPRLRSFDEVMAEYDACLDYLAGMTVAPSTIHGDT